MKNINLDNVQEASDFKRLCAGGYIAVITAVEDVPGKEYLRVEYDIAEGEYTGYYKELSDSLKFWGGRFYRSYKETALPFFKSFVTSVEASNSGFKFGNDETAFIGKHVGIILGEEEYIGNDGATKVRVNVESTRSVQAIKDGDFEIPEFKALPSSGPTSTDSSFVSVSDGDEELPFN
ncbi:MAG: hypothetical protein ACK5MN_03305 [Lachnospiraceae bacterium]